MRLLNCVIADDEKLARDVLQNYVERDGCCRLSASFSDGKSLQSFLLTSRVDVLLLDIEMPGLGGLDLIRSLSNPPSIIFTTAYSEYAVDAFALSATDYLLKPISFERFRQALEKVKAQRFKPATSEPKFVDVTVDRRKISIPIDDVIFLEAVGNYVKIHLAERFFITYGSIQRTLALFPVSRFVQIHRSYVVNMIKVQSYSATSVTVGLKQSLPLGRNFKGAFLSAKAGRV